MNEFLPICYRWHAYFGRRLWCECSEERAVGPTIAAPSKRSIWALRALRQAAAAVGVPNDGKPPGPSILSVCS